MSAAQAVRDRRQPFPEMKAPSIEMVRLTVRRLRESVINTADWNRRDRLWASHYDLFSTNPLSLLYGACGTSVFLASGEQPLDARVLEWIRSHRPNHNSYPPGLAFGLAGLAVSSAEYGDLEFAIECEREATLSPLLANAPANVAYGLAGVGLASICIYSLTKQDAFLQKAAAIGERICRAAKWLGEECYWSSDAERIALGWGEGVAGISLFLSRLFGLTGLETLRTHARAGLEFVIAQAIYESADGGPHWTVTAPGRSLWPYWYDGSAGIASVLCETSQMLDVPRYTELAIAAGRALYCPFLPKPGFVHGMAGVGETMLDLFDATKDPHWSRRAALLAGSIDCFIVDSGEQLWVPGEVLSRFGHDFATGSAGVGLFLNRLAGGARALKCIR